jgi:hypothetical protein
VNVGGQTAVGPVIAEIDWRHLQYTAFLIEN